jgi:predicted phage terminase large subunit-like protein
VIEAPPRHGKTELTSVRLPALAFGKHPDITFIAASHTADLAQFINREVQRVIDTPEYAELFPETRLWGRNIRTVADGSYLRNSDVFEIVNHRGIYKCAGIGGPITGKGGHVLLVDDPVKDAAEAASKTVRDGIWEWYLSTLSTRQAPGAGILLIMTRWHEDDLAGRLLERSKKAGEHWDEFRFPAVAEEDEFDEKGKLLRRTGEALHQERYSIDLLNKIKTGTEDKPGVGSKVWASLYQQRPSAAAGNIFKRENWRFIKPPKPLSDMDAKERREWLAAIGVRIVQQSWDTALGGKKKDDNTACATIGIGASRYYVMDIWKGKLQFPDALKQVELLDDKWGPNKVVVEGGGSASGKATVQVLNRSTRIPFKEVATSKDKEFRADTISPTHEAGLIYIVEGGGWQADFVDQCANFPNITNDDDVDAWMIGMEAALGKRAGLNITDEFLARI